MRRMFRRQLFYVRALVRCYIDFYNNAQSPPQAGDLI
jgi:hypothetical protein